MLLIGLSTSFASPHNVDRYVIEYSTTITKEQVAELNGKLETLAKDRSIQCIITAFSAREMVLPEIPSSIQEDLDNLIVNIILHDSAIESREESDAADSKLEKDIIKSFPQSFKAKNHYEGVRLIVDSIIKMLNSQGKSVSDIDPDLEKQGIEIHIVQVGGEENK